MIVVMRLLDCLVLFLYDAITPVWMAPMRLGLFGNEGFVFHAWSYLLGIPMLMQAARSALERRCKSCMSECGDRCGKGCNS